MSHGLSFAFGAALSHSPEDLRGRHDLGLGRLEDGVTVAPCEDVPGEADVLGIVVFGGLAGAAQVVDLGLDLTSVLTDAQDLFGDGVGDSLRGEAESLLAADFALRPGEDYAVVLVGGLALRLVREVNLGRPVFSGLRN